jgi:hypothetical protein
MRLKHVFSIGILPLLILLQSNSCEKKDPNCPDGSHNGLVISNQSARTINMEFYWRYPDTTIGEYNPLYDGTEGFLPGEELQRGAGRHTCWESVLREGRKHWVHIFDQDSLRIIPWDTIRVTGRGLLERRLIDLEYLRANDFKIVFK